MPLIEAIPDENNIMIHRLITLNQGTSKLPVISATTSKIELNLGGDKLITPKTLNFNDVSSQSEPSGYLFTIADRRLLSSFGGNTQTIKNASTAFSQTVSGTSVNLVALNSTSLFGNNSKLLTTLTIEGRDTGARVTIPLEINKNITGTQFVQGTTGVQIK